MPASICLRTMAPDRGFQLRVQSTLVVTLILVLGFYDLPQCLWTREAADMSDKNSL
jgi:hypothetical protein